MVWGQDVFTAKLVTAQRCFPSLGSGRQHSTVHHILGMPCEARGAAPCRGHAGMANSFPLGREEGQATSSAVAGTHGGRCFWFMKFVWYNGSRDSGNTCFTGIDYQIRGQIVIQRSVFSWDKCLERSEAVSLVTRPDCEELSREANPEELTPCQGSVFSYCQSWNSRLS